MKKKILIILALLLTCFSVSAQNDYDFKVKTVGHGEPVIMIPGFGCSGDVWNDTAQKLKNDYESSIIYIPGFAGLAPIDTPVLRSVKEQILSYVKKRKLSNIKLVGHSMGGTLALWLASSEPALFTKVIIVDAVPFVSALNDSTMTEAKAKSIFNEKIIVDQMLKIPEAAYIKNSKAQCSQMVSDSLKADMISNWAIISDRRTLGSVFCEMSVIDLRKDVGKIKCPVLILGSKHGTLQETEKLFSKQYQNLKNKTLALSDSKHFIMYDDPTWFNEQVAQFFKL